MFMQLIMPSHSAQCTAITIIVAANIGQFAILASNEVLHLPPSV